MFTVSQQGYTRTGLLDELRRQSTTVSVEDDVKVVWHDEFDVVLEELETLGLTTYNSIPDLLLRIGGMLVGEEGYRRSYTFFVQQAAKRLLDAGPQFEQTETTKRYDNNWEHVIRTGGDWLRLKQGVSPHAAVLAMVSGAGDWTFDCATYVQAVQWYARARAVGAQRFDKEMGGKEVLFKEHESTGLRHRKIFFKEAYNAEWRLRTPRTDKIDAQEPTCKVTEMVLLRIAPVGSRVTFANADPMAEGTDFERENTVKFGADTFASHPFGIGSAADVRHKLAQQTLLRYEGEITAALRVDDSSAAREALAEADKLVTGRDTTAQVDWVLRNRQYAKDLLHDDLDEYIAENVYLSEVELYEITPETPETLAYS
jgi:hypothetical protein